MLEPGGKKQELAGSGRDGDAYAGADPGQLDSGRFVHRYRRTARVAKVNLTAFHSGRDLHIIGRRKKTARMTVQRVGVAGAVYIDPSAEDKAVLLLALFGTKVV